MIGLKVYADGKAEVKDIDTDRLYDEVGGEPEEYRPFVDKTIAMIINKEAGVREGRNKAIPFTYLNGTVLFLRAKGKSETYTNLDEERIDRLTERFPKIELLEEEKCETSLSLRERFIAWLTKILMISR